MFDLNTKNLWINYLSGTLHDGYVVDMIIGTDGKSCRGLYILRSSKTIFTFDGDEVNQQLQLIEQDADGRHTGFLVAKYDGEKFNGIWTSKDRKRKFALNLSFVNAFSDYQPIAHKYNYWDQYFSNKVDGKEISLNVKREGDIVTYKIKEDRLTFKDAAVIESTDRFYNLLIQKPTSSLHGKTITLDTANINQATIASLDESGYEKSIILKSDRRMTYQNTMYADKSCMLKCQRPSVGHLGFDKWMENQCKRWLDKKTIELGQSKIHKLSFADRWTQSAEAWVEVTLFADDLISGAIYFQSSWDNGTDMVPFIYSISDGREIRIKDLFQPNFNFQTLLDGHLQQFKQGQTYSKEKKSWVMDQNFDKIMLTPEGIMMRSNFSTIHGEVETVFPFETIADKVKNKALTKVLLQQ